MNPFDDPEDMTIHDLLASDDHIDALLRGDEPADAELTTLFRAAQAPAQVDELAGRDRAVSMMANGGVPIVTALPVRRVGRRRLATKSAVVAAAILTLGTAAAAATGVVGSNDPVSPVVTTSSTEAPTTSLPSETSTTTSTSSTTTSTTSTSSTTSTTVVEPTTPGTRAVGPDATGPARHGLCTAFGARDTMPGKSVAAQNLTDAATAAGQTVSEFCAEEPSNGETTTTMKSSSSGGTPNSHANPAAGGSSNANPNANAGGNSGQAGASNPSSSAGGTPNANANPAAGGSSNANANSNAGGNGSGH